MRRSRSMTLIAAVTAAAAAGASFAALARPSGHAPPAARGAARSAPVEGVGVALAARPTKVLTVVEENRTASSATNTMPYLASLGRTYGHTTAYRAVTHPSLPNYLALAGGSTFGVRDDNAPSAHHVSGQSVFDQALAHGRTARTYAEGMPSSCALTSTGRYAVKHNPWAYFSSATSRAGCRRYDVPAGTTSAGRLHDDVVRGTLPNLGLLIPDLCHDGHDCSSATADAWLKRWLPVVMAGPDYRAGRLAIVVTFDEDDRTGSNTVLTTVVAPRVRGVVARQALTHYSWTRYVDALVGAPPLRAAGSAASLRGPFPL